MTLTLYLPICATPFSNPPIPVTYQNVL